MRTSPHRAKNLASSQIPKTFVFLAQSETSTKSCQDSPQTSNGHLPWQNRCVFLSYHTQIQQGCLCFISVLGTQQIQEKQGSLRIHARSWGVERNHVCNSSMPTAKDLSGSFQLGYYTHYLVRDERNILQTGQIDAQVSYITATYTKFVGHHSA